VVYRSRVAAKSTGIDSTSFVAAELAFPPDALAMWSTLMVAVCGCGL
jgi:hypothetical protein